MKPNNEFSDVNIGGGAAVRSDDGWTLPPTGNSPADEGAVFHKASITSTASVPADVVSEEIGVNALVSVGSHVPSGGVVKLQLRVECLDTGSRYDKNLSIPAGIVRKNIALLSNTNLNGASTQSNRIKVTLTRRDSTEDTCNDSLTIHNLDIQMRRAGMHGRAMTNSFRPYQ